MSIRSTVAGTYPKPPPEGEVFRVRKLLHAVERQEAHPDELEQALRDATVGMIREQEDAGLDIVSDGGAGWEDILNPFARGFAGFEVGPLFRWFDNNVYYRRPVCIGDVGWTAPCTVTQAEFALATARRALKVQLPGPVSFARLSLDEHYDDHERFTLAIADALAEEAAALEAAGVRLIQIDEPALLDAPEDVELAQRAIGRITARLTEARTHLLTYFGDAKRLGRDLFEIPVDGFGFDLVSGPENLSLIEEAPAEAEIQAGVVDARNTRLEDAAELKKAIERVASLVAAERLLVAPSASLEFLPREKAKAKLERLATVAKEVAV